MLREAKSKGVMKCGNPEQHSHSIRKRRDRRDTGEAFGETRNGSALGRRNHRSASLSSGKLGCFECYCSETAATAHTSGHRDRLDRDDRALVLPGSSLELDVRSI
jgi:hypothetical protein